MKEKDLSVTEETSVKESLWDYREKEDKFLRKLTKSLADKTKALAIATTADGDVYCAGYANILEMPEFFDIDVMKNLLSTMDEFEAPRKYFADIVSEDVQVLLGDELGPDMQGPYGFVFTHYKTPGQLTGEVGVLGPSRLNYTQIVPTVRYFGDLIEEIAKGW